MHARFGDDRVPQLHLVVHRFGEILRSQRVRLHAELCDCRLNFGRVQTLVFGVVQLGNDVGWSACGCEETEQHIGWEPF